MSTGNAHPLRPILDEFKDATRDALIPMLQRVQDQVGYLSQDSIAEIGRHLKLPASKIYGVATFYNQFRFQPKGQHHIMLCRGTACHVKGSKKLLDEVVKALGIQPGETTRDRLFSLEVVACMGACGLAPVVCIDGEFHSKVTPMRFKQLIDELRVRKEVRDVVA